MKKTFLSLALITAVSGAFLVSTTSVHSAPVRSKSGKTVQVAPSAQRALQCVVDYLEQHGVRITSMRGYGRGSVPASLHPSGRALDVNQYARDRVRPKVPRHISNAAADTCGVISGARWNNADNGHWNLPVTARRRAQEKALPSVRLTYNNAGN
jgi:hypothetical protein